MDNSKFKFNPETLSYEEAKLTARQKFFRKYLPQVLAGIVFAYLLFLAWIYIVDTAEDRRQKQENALLKEHIEQMEKDYARTEKVLKDLQKRDDNIYRAIFESEPVPFSVRENGYQASKYTTDKKKLDFKLVAEQTSLLADSLLLKLNKETPQYEQMVDSVKAQADILKYVPGIQPVNNVSLEQIYGYGLRVDPIYKTSRFHAGMDFAAPTGTKVRATADGRVLKAVHRSRDHGKYIIIKHNDEYQTLYAHLDKLLVHSGQQVKRGEAIGTTGNTGKSVAPHVHYEVHRNKKPVNPINFFFLDLSPEQYNILIKITSQSGQSLD